MKDRKILIIIFIIALVLDQVTKVIGYVNGWNIGTYMQPVLREMRLE